MKVKIKQILDMDSKMPIGQYKGRYIRSILIWDAWYLVWFRDTVEEYEFGDMVKDMLRDFEVISGIHG